MAQEVNGPNTIISIAVKLAFQIGGNKYLGWKPTYDWILDTMMFGNDNMLPYNRCPVSLYEMLGDDTRIALKVMKDSIVGQ